ncbi:hypothetical protein KAR91_23755 [Candidatus Pacearchaeota archaeon]|nr:hypothetical protein [Candidatus Pacearchaeota archaeon]
MEETIKLMTKMLNMVADQEKRIIDLEKDMMLLKIRNPGATVYERSHLSAPMQFSLLNTADNCKEG